MGIFGFLYKWRVLTPLAPEETSANPVKLQTDKEMPEGILFNKCVFCKEGQVKVQTKKGLFGLTSQQIIGCSVCNTEYIPIGKSEFGQDKFRIKTKNQNFKETLYDWRVFYSNELIVFGKGKNNPIVEILDEMVSKKEDGIDKIDLNVTFQSIDNTQGIVLEKDENVYYSESAALLEERVGRSYSTGYAGVRVSKGVFLGGSQGQSEPTHSVKQLDAGSLSITNSKLLFRGSFKNIQILPKEIISLNFGKDYIAVGVKNREKLRYFTVDDGLRPYVLIQAMTKKVRS